VIALVVGMIAIPPMMVGFLVYVEWLAKLAGL
jgi:hypothetical protein